MQTYRLHADYSRAVSLNLFTAFTQHFTIGQYIYSLGEKKRRAGCYTTARPDRFNAKCRRVLHAVIMVEIYVANISQATLSRLCVPKSPTWKAFVYRRHVTLVIGPHMDTARYFIFYSEMKV